jgi:hypothetical protein
MACSAVSASAALRREVSTAIAAILDEQSVRLEVRGEQGDARNVILDLEQLSVDELSRGEFFTKLGFAPRRPKVPPVIGALVPGEAAEEAGLVRTELGPIRDGRRAVELDLVIGGRVALKQFNEASQAGLFGLRRDYVRAVKEVARLWPAGPWPPLRSSW